MAFFPTSPDRSTGRFQDLLHHDFTSDGAAGSLGFLSGTEGEQVSEVACFSPVDSVMIQ